MQIGRREVGPGYPVFVIAEAGVNHNGDCGLALDLVQAAADAGADAVKFQTFSSDRLVTENAPKAGYQLETTESSESQRAMLERLELSLDEHVRIKSRCEEVGVIFMSTPFDEGSADLLLSLGVDVFKIPSGEIINLPYIEHIALMGKPMIISTGMATLAEVDTCVRSALNAGNSQLALLHCVTNYPASPADVNLRAMLTMGRSFGLPIGYSDHTLGVEIALASIALGACIVEKHLTLNRNASGPDHRASLEPKDFTSMVEGVRSIERAMGDGFKRPAQSETNSIATIRKSLVLVADLPAGAVLRDKDIEVKRPGTGLAPSMKRYVIGRTLATPAASGSVLTLEMLK